MRGLARFMMHGRVQAIGTVVSLAILSLIVSPLVILTTAGVALVTLVQGYKEGLLNLVVSTIVLMLFISVALSQPAIGLELAIKFWLPAWLFASVLITKQSMSLALVVAAALSGLLVIGFYVVNEPANYWYEVISKQLIPVLKQAGMQVEQGPDAEKLWVFMSKIMTGSALALFLALQTMSLLLARWWQALLYNPGGFGKEFQRLQFGKGVAGIALIICIFAVATSNEAAINLLFVVTVLMMFQGLAVVHGLVANCKLSSAVLVIMYFIMFFTLQFGALGLLFIALLGLLDNWLNLRFRFCANKVQDDLN